MELEPDMHWHCRDWCGKSFLTVRALRKHAHTHPFCQPRTSSSPNLPSPSSLLQLHTDQDSIRDSTPISDSDSVIEIDPLPLPDPPLLDPPHQLVHDDRLTRLGVVINKKHRLIICNACRLPYLPHILSSHLFKKHGLPRIDDQTIALLTSTYNLHASIESVEEIWPVTIQVPYEGISILEGEYCSQCPYTSMPATMKVHYQKHPNVLYSSRTVGPVQQIYLCSQFARYIRVNSLSSCIQDEPYAVWFRTRHIPDPHPVPSDNQLTPSWLLRLGWKKYLANYSPKDVLPFILIPKQGFPFAWVVDAVKVYLTTLVQCLTTLPNQVRGWLASVDG